MNDWICRSLFVFSMLPLLANAAAAKCDDPALKKFLAMDYKSFDQSPPDGGWRIMQDKGRDPEIAAVLDGYRECRKGLKPEQVATLAFHAGQIYADLGETAKAIERMERSHDRTLDSKYHWNSLVDGTISFLKKDASKLRAARDRIEAAESDHPYVATLNNLIRCFGVPYKNVGPSCVPASGGPSTAR